MYRIRSLIRPLTASLGAGLGAGWGAACAVTLAVTLAGAFAPLAAQDDCPYERAETVAPSWRLGPALVCDAGVVVDIPGVRINQMGTACPLFVIITPTHEVAVPSDRRTRTRETGQDPEQTAFFTCTPHSFLFIRTSSTCDLDRIVVTGAVRRLATEACGPLEVGTGS